MSRVSRRSGGTGTARLTPPPPLLQTLEDDDLAGQVDALRRQRQGFGDAATGVKKGAAERPHLARSLPGGGQKCLPLVVGEVEPPALAVEQLHVRNP